MQQWIWGQGNFSFPVNHVLHDGGHSVRDSKRSALEHCSCKVPAVSNLAKISRRIRREQLRRCADHDDVISVGVALAIGSGLLIGSSFVFKKKGLLSSQKDQTAGEGVAYLKSVCGYQRN